MIDFRSIRAKPSGVGQASAESGHKTGEKKKVFEMFKVRWWCMKHEIGFNRQDGLVPWSLAVFPPWNLYLQFKFLAPDGSATLSGIKDCLICRDALKLIHSFIHSTSIY